MPIYTYICEACDTRFEAFASIKKKESGWQPQCPRCGSPQSRQVFTAVSVIASPRAASPAGGCCSPRRQ